MLHESGWFAFSGTTVLLYPGSILERMQSRFTEGMILHETRLLAGVRSDSNRYAVVRERSIERFNNRPWNGIIKLFNT